MWILAKVTSGEKTTLKGKRNYSKNLDNIMMTLKSQFQKVIAGEKFYVFNTISNFGVTKKDSNEFFSFWIILHSW